MKWAIVNEIGNEEKRTETIIVDAETPTKAMLEEFSNSALDMISRGKQQFEEESATIAVYEVFENEDGDISLGKFNHLIAINDRSDLARNMQKLLDEEKAKIDKYLLFDGSNFLQPSEAFQKEWGIEKLEVQFLEDGRIRTQSVSRFVSANCIHWGMKEEQEEEFDE
ncbi:hypothetical protein [Enterococcus wangshanyuanii]|uniref:Uncharacterized protein n=1 Tax=Enterococcus wangshanyuanii TaxID=2005703 RepID=A0ABQ1P2P4_9ENTE|nr:hypothetical protein [Enterococcus wangshanyuanii]GGC88182.1 hypothetical protein GCM10011573_17230 [Enterococcus wangshanyuanii]